MSFLRVVTPDDIKDEQRTLSDAAADLDAIVSHCTGLDAGKKAAWETLYASIQSFCQEVPVWFIPSGSNEVVMSSNMLERAIQYQHNVANYRKAFTKPCNITTPGYDPYKQNDTGDQILQALRYAAIIAGFVGTAYVVGKTVEVIQDFEPRRS
jgi:hypothetical protein